MDLVTTTVNIPVFEREVERFEVTSDPVAALDTGAVFPLGVVPERVGKNRYRGYGPASRSANSPPL